MRCTLNVSAVMIVETAAVRFRSLLGAYQDRFVTEIGIWEAGERRAVKLEV